MADLQKKDAVVSNVQLDADSLEFDVNTNLPLMAAKASPGGPTPSLQELIEAELSVRLCQPDSLEPPSSPTLHSLLSCDSIEPVPAHSAVPPSAPVFSLDSLADLDPLKDSLGQADAESGIDLLSPTKLDNLSNPDSLESDSDLMESPARSSPPPRGNFPLLYAVPDSHNQEIAAPAIQAPLLTMKENLAPVVGEALLSSAPGPTQKSQESLHSNIEAIHQFHLSDDSCVDLQAGQMLLRVSDSDLLSVESLSVSKSGSVDPSDLSETSGDLCATPDFSNSNMVQGDGAPHTTSEDVCESGDWAAGGLAAPGASLIPGLTLASNSPSTDPSSTSPPPSSPQDPSSSPLPPSPHAGALTPSSTNSVCGDSSHAGDEDCGVGIGWSGDDGGGERPCHPPSCDDSGQDPPPPTHTNMEEEDDEDDDFWSSMKNDEDNDHLASNNSYMKEEEVVETKLEYEMKYSEKSECRVESSETQEYEIKYSERDEYESKFFEEDEARMEEDEEDDNLEIEDEDDEELLEMKGLLLRKKKSRAENGVSKIEEATEKKKPRAEKIVAKTGEPTEKKPRAEKIVAKTEEPSEKRKPQAENGVAKTEESTEKKKSRAEKIVEKADESTEKKPRAENGVDATDEVTEKKKKKKMRSSEDGEKKKKKKKKRGESEKENKDSTSSISESEEELAVPPTPPLFNGRALTNGLSHRAQEEELLLLKDQEANEDKWVNKEQHILEESGVSDTEVQYDHEGFSRENFHSLVDTYNNKQEQEEVRSQSPLSDQDNLAGVDVKKLTVSYLSVVQSNKVQANNHKCDVQSEIKADLNTSVNISSLVNSYSSPPPLPRATTPSTRPDDLMPVSFRSLKSAYEASASGASGTGSRHSSSGSSSPTSGSPAPKDELNISLHQLREEYCRSVQDGHSRSQTPSRAAPDTGISIRQLQVCQVSSDCRQCGKQVFQMEKIVAEKASWHKNCFRCKECNCILTLETYQSHEGVLYCKPHFKELFRPKVVVEDETEARKERSSNKTDYGLEELSTANLKQKFAMFELISTEEERRPDPIPVRRSQSLLGKAARFQQSEDDDYGIENAELGEYEEYDEEEEDEEDEDEDEEEGKDGEIKTKKGRPTSFSGMQDLKAGFDRKNRREEMTKKRREELAKFRQMLCAGKNITTREMFEGGNEDEEGLVKRKEQIKIDGCPAAKNLRERFEKGLSINEEDEETEERREVDHVFRQADTATKARNMFKKIDTAVVEGEEPVMRPRSSAQARRENRLSRDGIDVEERELGRDPNLIKCTDVYEDEVDCRGTRDLLAKFKKLEMQAEDDDQGPRPLKRFTPPPGGEEEYDSEEDYSDEEYSDEEEEDSEEEDEEEEEDEGKPKYKDEILEMVNSSQSARKAASLRAKFEKWETEVERNNEYNHSEKIQEEEEEGMPSIDTARNLRAMFENKAQEAARPVTERSKPKVNRFV